MLAVDGKTLRGARGGGPPAKLVAVYDYAHQLVLTQPAHTAGWTRCLTCGCAVTADAREPAAYLRGRGAPYLRTVQGNPPSGHRRTTALP